MPPGVDYRSWCCGFCHVRVTTFCLSTIQLLAHVVVVVILALSLSGNTLLNADMQYVLLSAGVMCFVQWERVALQRQDDHPLRNVMNEYVVSPVPAPTTLSMKLRNPFGVSSDLMEKQVTLVMTLFSFLFSSMALTGTVYARPYYLLPCCCLQVMSLTSFHEFILQFIDVFVTCLSVAAYYSYLSEDSVWKQSHVSLL